MNPLPLPLPLPQIEPYQTRILCMTSMLFYLPTIYMIYKRSHKYQIKHQINNTVGQTLGILSCITGTCSILYWHDQNHDSWRYHLDLFMAKFTGVVFFINGHMYILIPYKRYIAYILSVSVIGSYYLSNSWYLEGSSIWYLWHGLMHISTNIGCIHILQSVYNNSPLSISFVKNEDKIKTI